MKLLSLGLPQPNPPEKQLQPKHDQLTCIWNNRMIFEKNDHFLSGYWERCGVKGYRAIYLSDTLSRILQRKHWDFIRVITRIMV